ncbi:centrosome and spindle pole-associated protein 1 [Narcine bancroftii]|uniref:centrosome and spindle pole-associated protein 1 n=1 Tax=Narcine bancroftii TaxID=1343680 RepID=UPI0038313C65
MPFQPQSSRPAGEYTNSTRRVRRLQFTLAPPAARAAPFVFVSRAAAMPDGRGELDGSERAAGACASRAATFKPSAKSARGGGECKQSLRFYSPKRVGCEPSMLPGPPLGPCPFAGPGRFEWRAIGSMLLGYGAEAHPPISRSLDNCLGGDGALLSMADELEKFLQEQRAKLEQDKIELNQDPPYMEMRTKSSEPLNETKQAADSSVHGKSLSIIQPVKENLQTNRSKEILFLEENFGVSLPLGLEYDQKKQKLKEELRQDYRRYMAEKSSRIVKELQPTVESLSLPISERKSAMDRLRTERNQEYNQLLREQDKYEQLRRDGRWIHKENIDPLDESRFQTASHLGSGQPQHESKSYRNDAHSSMEAYEELLNKKRQEEDRYRRSDDPEIGHRRNVQTQTDRSGDYENYFPDSNNYFQRWKNEYRQYKEQNDQELPTHIENVYRKEHRKRPVSAAENSRYLINEIHDSSRERSKSASVKDDAIFGTGLLLGNNERESAQRRRRERYRQELLEQISESQKSKKREKELELNVAATGAVDPEKEPDRIRQFGAVMHQQNSRRHDAPDQRGGVHIRKYSNVDRSAEVQPPERPRVAFQTPEVDERNLSLTSGVWNPIRKKMAPRVIAVPPPPPPPVLMEHYHTPYDNAYYFYGARNPLDPNLAYYGPGVIGAQPISLMNPPSALTTLPMQGYPHPSFGNQPFMSDVHDATTVGNLNGGFLPAQPADLSKESAQTYQDFLKKQMQEREERKRKEKEETERYDAKLEQDMKIYNPWGRGGGGAPLRDAEGNLLTDLKKMHKQNENAYRDFPHQGNQDSKVMVPFNVKDQGFMLANASQLSQGNSAIEQQTERKIPDQEKYKEYLRLQIEEKRRKAEEEREKCKLEEQREERRLVEQRARIAKELEEEQEKKRRKEEEQRLKNEEIVRLAEERRKEAERKRKEEEEKQELLFRQQIEREQSARVDERAPSPPIPTINNKQVIVPRANLSPANGSIHEFDLHRPLSGTKSPPVPARRNQLRAHEEKRDIISELSALRRQLRSEERRLEDQFQNIDVENDGAVAIARKRERNHVDVFDLARQRIQALVHRPSSKGTESANSQNIREFNNLKYRDSATRAQVRQKYPDPPNDSNTLEIQQEALLREQKKKLDIMKKEEAVSCMNSSNIALTDSQEDLTKNSLLESESAFLGSHGETFPYPVDVETTARKLPPRERRRRNRSRLESEVQPESQLDSIYLHSANSFNVDHVRARNEQRMKHLHDLQQAGKDIMVEDDDILTQFISKDKERPSSVETEATEVWLRPGTSETLKRFMADHTQLDRGPLANTSAFNWRS